MSDPPIRNPAYHSLTDQQLAEIDECCDCFDEELHRGRGPRIETFLADAPEAARDDLLAELLAIEVEFRSRQGEEPQPDDYLPRFRAQESVIAKVFFRGVNSHFPTDRTILGDSHDPAPTDVRPELARFRLIKELGCGGMGVVWLAEQDEPVKRRVALKLIRSGLSSQDVLARFGAEKQALAMMDHPNIARVLDAGTTNDGRPYFVMELVDGVPITQYCDHHRLSVDERLRLFVSVCKGVQHAHQKGVIHRDLKPSNVLVTEIDGDAVPKVIDFGLAKAVEQQLHLSEVTLQTEFGKIVGTVQYMSPEQAELKGPDAEDIDTRTDVYSLGVMLYELLTGSTPLDQETLGRSALLRILQIIQEVVPPRPSHRLSSSSHEVNSAVSDSRRSHPARLQQLLRGELDWVVMKTLEKDRNRRYQTANGLAQDLSNYLTGETVTARPPSTWYQIQKFARRNRGLVAALLAIGVVLVVGVAGTLYGLLQANEKAKVADQEKGKAQRNETRAVEAERRAEAESQRARDSEASAKFQLAKARWDAHRAADARRLLHEIPDEYRNSWEWNFCSQLFQGSDITCYGHLAPVNCVVFSPDETRIATGSTDRTIKLWDAVSGEELTTLSGHAAAVVTIAFSPDGSRLASGSDDSSIKIWDTQSWQELQSLDGHEGSVRSVAFSPNGRILASGSDDRFIRLWDLQSGQTGRIAAHSAEIAQVTFSPDGGRLISTALDGLVKLWDVTAVHSVEERLTLVTAQPTRCVAISPDGSRIATGSFHMITLWDATSGSKLNAFIAHPSWVFAVSFSPDGERLATGGEDSLIRLWDAHSGQEIVTLAGHSQRCRGVAFSPDGERLASVSQDGTLKLWDARSFQQAISLRGHTASVASVAFDPRGQRLASASNDGTIKMWDSATGQEVTTLTGHTGWVRSVAFSPAGKRLASAGRDKSIRLWDGQSGREERVMTGHSDAVHCVAFSPDGARLASGSPDATIKLWNVDSGQEQQTLRGHTHGVRCVTFNRDGTRLASASDDNTIIVWDANSGKELLTFKGHALGITCLAFDPNGQLLASAGNDHSIKLWNLPSGRERATLNGHLMGVSWVAFSPDGRRLASTGWDHTLKMWDAHTCREVATIEDRHESLQCGAWDPDGVQLAAAGGDNTVRLWSSGQDLEVTTLTGHTNNVNRVTFSHDGKRIYSESATEQLVWDMATGMPEANAKWEPPAEQQRLSPDGRWFVTSEFNHVLLVDREHRNTPREKAYRTGKARFDRAWHDQQASAATTAMKWYAATFHYACLVQNDPGRTSYDNGLQSSFQELQSQLQQQERDLEPHLAMVVAESLNLSRGSKAPNSSFEKPRIRNGSWAFVEAIPRWKSTEEAFEIWSSGFLGVAAHDGDQFVELNAKKEGALYQDLIGIEANTVIEFSFAHRGRNGEDTLRLTITDLGEDSALGGGDDHELFAREYTTGKEGWAVYDSSTEPPITALGNNVRFAFTAVHATGGKGPDNTEGNFLDAACFGVGVVSAKRNAYGVKRLQAYVEGGNGSETHYLGMRDGSVGIPVESSSNGESIFVLKIEPHDNVAVLKTSDGRFLTAQGESVVLTDTVEPGSRWIIRNPLKAELNPNEGWFSLESADDPERFLRHYSLVVIAHKKAELSPGQAALFQSDASWRFVDSQ